MPHSSCPRRPGGGRCASFMVAAWGSLMGKLGDEQVVLRKFDGNGEPAAGRVGGLRDAAAGRRTGRRGGAAARRTAAAAMSRCLPRRMAEGAAAGGAVGRRGTLEGVGGAGLRHRLSGRPVAVLLRAGGGGSRISRRGRQLLPPEHLCLRRRDRLPQFEPDVRRHGVSESGADAPCGNRPRSGAPADAAAGAASTGTGSPGGRAAGNRGTGVVGTSRGARGGSYGTALAVSAPRTGTSRTHAAARSL